MSPFETYKIFNSLKLHFNSNYDYFKYRGKSRSNIQSFEKCKGKYFYSKIGAAFIKKDDLVSFFVSNFINDNKLSFIGDFIDDDCDEVYTDWQRRNQALYKEFVDDCHIISLYCDEFNITYKDIFFESDGKLPVIFGLVNNKNISFETIVVLNKFLNFINRRNYINPLAIKWKIRLTKYENFVNIYELNRFVDAFKSIVINKMGVI